MMSGQREKRRDSETKKEDGKENEKEKKQWGGEGESEETRHSRIRSLEFPDQHNLR